MDFQDSGAVENLTRGGETCWGVRLPSACQSYVYIFSVSYSSISAAKFIKNLAAKFF